MRLRSLLPFLLAAMMTIGVYWFSEIPLGITGEWTWERIPFVSAEMVPGWIVSGIAFGVYLLAALIGLSRIRFCYRWELVIWLLGLAASGIVWSLLLQDTPPTEYRLSKAAFVLYYKGSSGYFTEARDGIPDVPHYLEHYAEKMKQGDVLHEGTHPPGLPLFYRALILLCQNVPGLQSALLKTQPASFQEATEIIANLTAASGNPLTDLDSAVLWLATLITVVLSALTVFPLFLLSREFASREVSWQVATFWPLIPAALIFQPKSDALYSIMAILFLYLWVVAWRRNSKPLYLLAGFVLWIGFFLTLAFLPVALCAVFYSLFEVWQLRSDKNLFRPAWKQFFFAAVFGLSGLVLPTTFMGVLFEINLPEVWFLNLQNHAGFYLQYPRTYWKWLLVNPLEISLALGLPVAWLAAKSLCSRRLLIHNRTEGPFHPGLKNLLLSCLIVLGLLWLSGKNMGEAARLWLVFLPWFLLMTIPYWHIIEIESAFNNESSASFLKLQSIWITALITQAIVCVATVNRITGFHFPPG
jgi:methylthioxylose transferase